MLRRPRLHLPDVPVHLLQRGHNREACFFSDDDYLAYLAWLGEALKKTGCSLHAYVLMTNHAPFGAGRFAVDHFSRPTIICCFASATLS